MGISIWSFEAAFLSNRITSIGCISCFWEQVMKTQRTIRSQKKRNNERSCFVNLFSVHISLSILQVGFCLGKLNNPIRFHGNSVWEQLPEVYIGDSGLEQLMVMHKKQLHFQARCDLISESSGYFGKWYIVKSISERETVVRACSVSSVASNSVTPWTIAHQAPLSMGFSRQEYWSGLPCPPPEEPTDPGIEPTFPASPALQVDCLPTKPLGSPQKD